MGEWITVDNFVDDAIVRAKTFQDIWKNLYNLKDGEFDIQFMPGESSDYWSTTSTTFVPIANLYYTLNFESFGGDLLIIANLESSNADASHFVIMTLYLDGVALGNTNGLYFKGEGDIFEAIPLIYVATGVDAGIHTIYVAMACSTSGEAKVFRKSCMNFSITELH